jgi:Fur family transcriptional regulator, ferric uptake regulator
MARLSAMPKDMAKDLVPGAANEDVLVRREALTPEQLKRIVRDLGLKVTLQRLSILKTLTQGRAHRTAQEIFEAAKRKDPTLGFATVYRLLRTLAEKKYVTEVRMGGLPARYELTPKNHHDHLTCTECGIIVEFENQSIERLQLQVAKERGFQLTGHVLELYGTCRQCRNH